MEPTLPVLMCGRCICVGIRCVIHTWLWHFSALFCVGGSEHTRSHIKRKKENQNKLHSCVIVSLPALALVYCKHSHANHGPTYLSGLWLRASLLPWAGWGVIAEACTHMPDVKPLLPVYSCLLAHADTSSLTQMAFFLHRGRLHLKALRCLIMPASSASQRKCSVAFFSPSFY